MTGLLLAFAGTSIAAPRAARPAKKVESPRPATKAVAESGDRITRIVIRGNQRVEEESVRIQLRSQVGGRLEEKVVDQDLRAIYRMGFFDNVDVDWEATSAVLTFQLTERPFIREVQFEGNDKLAKDDLDAALKVRANTILDPQKVRRGIDDAKKEYSKKGYLDAAITYTTTPSAGNNEATLIFHIDEGKIIRIDTITFEGAIAFSARKLRGLMQTKEESIFSFFTGAGNLDQEVLKTDSERLTAWYYENGYIDAKIDEPQVERRDDKLFVTIKIDEGDQYKTGVVDVGGDMPADVDAAKQKLGMTTGEIFKTSKLREDITALTDVYGDEGYAFVNVTPDTNVNPTEKTVDVTYKVSKGPEVFIDKIDISGNTKTRDKVIRRELRLDEQKRFSGTGLKRSQERLRRLGFFEDVNLTTRKAQGDNKLDLLVDVKEASTGAFSAGAGISSGENYLFNVRLQELNFLGRAERIVLNADFGSIRRNFSADFSDPYFLDTNFTAGVSLFNWRLQFSEFTRGGTGAAFRLLYPINALGFPTILGFSTEDTRIGAEYRIEEAEISQVSAFAPADIRAEQGTKLTSSITPRLFRDTRNSLFDPSNGSLQDISLEVAGLGGDSQFIKFEARGRWYHPIWRYEPIGTFVLAFGANFGYGFGYGDFKELPLFERYFPGGINSVRGYRILTLGQRVPVISQDGFLIRRESIGGSQQLIFNNEIIFPIVESIGLKGVGFFDAGNAFLAARGIELNGMRMSAGGGIRWLSPIGPLRLEMGVPLNPRVGDDKQTFMFSFGGPP